jgi:prepilin-type N-terminal cleavage/methylation domain-containing protein
MRKKIFKKLNNRGFSLGEMLVAILILLLATSATAEGIRVTSQQYHKSMIQSESKLLNSTLSTIIQSELSNTSTIKLGSKVSGNTYKVDKILSPTYAIDRDLCHFYSVKNDDGTFKESSNGYGELMLGVKTGSEIEGNLLVSSEMYTSYDLKANVDVTYDTDKKIFHVVLKIKSNDKEVSNNSFDVIPLTEINIEE